MSSSVELRSRTADVVAFFAACAVGFSVRSFLPAGEWSDFGPVLIAYHVFLLWLVLTAEERAGFSLPIVSTLVTHFACMACVAAIVLGRHFIPLYRYVGLGISGLAFFERDWLFVKTANGEPEEAKDAPAVTSTAEDYELWLRMRSEQKHSSFYVGGSPKSDFEAWVKVRAQRQALAASLQDSGD